MLVRYYTNLIQTIRSDLARTKLEVDQLKLLSKDATCILTVHNTNLLFNLIFVGILICILL